ncbi:aminodeoxychorismate synthase component I [Reichenbachiella carrageenanivorans]|uniref:Aminodeoxychorismate synthase component I n=1 Tax=Reichenbachiella carrageenanivorans TaxID=2979869 RepID=A0ABY6CYM2_9BACT|nr:aminodeoxychorismate synthase component I [Reichenbachiella carrageenanivorans]UXX79021.1 aminodeoxychorismate synthase component I [Reichenbachiella carrageenanivorans]
MNKSAAIQQINLLASSGTPFLLITDFQCANNQVLPIDQIKADQLLFDINGVRNFEQSVVPSAAIRLNRTPMTFSDFKAKYETVHAEIAKGNTYLLNLTQPTPITTTASLKEIFYHSKAKYKLWYKDQFVVFSPEIFIKIQEGKISSYPMKGTIDAGLPHAAETILTSDKEMAEHATIVDLIRNDMSQFAHQVKVEDFRYIDEIRTSEKHLLQVSSKITGQLAANYQKQLGEIIYSLLPAGSICGAPKQKTLDIIDQVEGYQRGYYTGIVGYFDGRNFDSGVMIRYIEKQDEQLVYKSGGGIHFLSDAAAEYQEMIDKVYVPVH